MNRTKKMIACLLCLIMVFSYGCQSILALEIEETFVEEQLEVIEDSIEVSDGLFDIEEIEESLEDESIDVSLIDAQIGLLEIYNEFAEDGTISLSDNGTIIIEEDENYYIEGGNVNKVVLKSNGIKIYKSKSATVSFMNYCKTAATISDVCKVIAKCCNIVSSSLNLAVQRVISFLLTAAFSSVSSICKTIVKQGTNANKGKYGIIVSMLLTGVTVTIQTKSTT